MSTVHLNSDRPIQEGGETAHEKQPIYCAEQIRIPPELPDIIKDYAKHMIRSKPKDLIAASAE